ncbi:hypothetical protein P43SY_010484 [Pythium insidiosum]|uniref:Reverse transcriptase n=1 Tax=Pythium insidiosum TaxID=114742 RepID=A0AAD5Q4R1_PYTIN|nr:hypothetical protein P43SY_010484 [Pythium insidiosum]
MLHAAHDDFQGGHQGVARTFDRLRREFYWHNMYRDVERYVKECVDCSTAKGRPGNPGPSPGNLMPEYPFQVISMDFVTPLPASRQGNTSLLLFQDSFTGFVLAKAMQDTSALAVAQAYDSTVFQRFGASSVVRHDRDPRFMSEVFAQFRMMIGAKQRATLAYRPQANGQQERSVQTVIRCARAYIESAEQDDWEDAVMRLLFAINTSVDATRRETPFFLVHGWDARSTVSAMLSPAPQGRDKLDAYVWRLRVQREQEKAIELAREYQLKAKAQRANQQTAAWNQLSDKYKAGFEIGNAVWLYYPRVKPGLSLKLAHAWHGPFRIVEKSDDYRVKLGITGSPYRISPWVHVSRLKPRVLNEDRPSPAEEAELPEEDDWDASLLPEDSWEADNQAGVFEVERILDVRWSTSRTRTQARRKEYLVQWTGYPEPEWVPLDRLNCGRLLHEFDTSRKAQNRFASMQTGDEQES